MNKLLASLTPIKSENALRFYQDEPIELEDQNTEAPAIGFAEGRTQMISGITEGIMSALGNIAGAYMKHKAGQQAKADETAAGNLQFERMKQLAELMRQK